MRSGSRPRDRAQVQLQHARRRRARARSPGRRARSRVAVADDVGAALERRPDHLARRARRARRRTAPPRPTGPSRRRRAAARGSPRRAASRPAPASRTTSRPSRASALRQQPRLGRLAGAVQAFEGHEHRAAYDTTRAGDRHRRRGLHRLARRRRAGRARRRGDGRRQPLDRAARERQPGGARSHEHDIREPLDGLRRGAGRRASTSPRRPTCGTSVERPDFDAEVNVLGTLRVLEAARRTARRSSSPRRAARSTASASARPARTTRGGRSRPTARRSSPARSTSRLEPPARDKRTSRCASRTSTGRGRTPTLEGGVVAIFLDRLARGRADARSSATGCRRATSSTSATSSRALLAAAGASGGVFNVGTGIETTVARALRALPRASPGIDGEPRREPRAATATSAAACSTSRSPSASSAGEPQTSLEDGLARTWDWIAGSVAGARAEDANRASVDAPCDRPARARPPWRTATLVAPRRRRGARHARRRSAVLVLGQPLSHARTPRSRRDRSRGEAQVAAAGEAGTAQPAVAAARALEDLGVIVLNGNGIARRRRVGGRAACAARATSSGSVGNAPRSDYPALSSCTGPGLSPARRGGFARDLHVDGSCGPLDGLKPSAAAGRAARADPRRDDELAAFDLRPGLVEQAARDAAGPYGSSAVRPVEVGSASR